ncbi:ATP-dependent DNA helicase [Trichonephila inaurata madagascariensis]|uniref:ATP-dependent DNA helicase n=1 Tax=Trichonephila inaurata madagascariensis TaxID=2747483 RepID=A0A8X6YTG5_9ARAC|nr:ATP-dependent DNA helicase [Trichonephila inaurata madagascariensis]
MTSFKSNVVLNNGWTPTFKVQGQVYHHARPLHPANAEDSKYLQIDFLGEDEQVQRRLDLLDSPVDRNIVLKLQRMLHQHNSYVRSFKMAAEIMDNTQVDYRIKISGKAPLKEYKGRFNAPSVSEVAIMIAGELVDHFLGYVTDNALGKVYTVHPNNRKAFHMRLLLHHVRGPISFEDLKTVIVRDEDGDILEIKPRSTYTEACQVLGQLEDDSHWYQAMEEAAMSQSPAQLQNIEYCDALFNNTLLTLEDKILSITSNKLALYGLPEPVHDEPELTSKDVLRETSYNVQALRAYMTANVPRLTPDQQKAFIAITGIIGSERGSIVFLDAPGQFANKLLQFGDGKIPEDPSTGLIIMPCGQIVNSPDELLSKKQLPGQEYAYKSIDCILNDDEAVQYPIEFLNSIQTPDLQAHNLILKVGALIILIRNIDAPRLCNSTRLIVKKLMQHVIQDTVLTGCAKGEDVFIPRIPIIPSDNTR